MVRFGVSSTALPSRPRDSTDSRSLSALYNNPKPTTPRQRDIDRIQNENVETRCPTDGAFEDDRRRSPFARASSHAYQLSGRNPESTDAGSRPFSPLRATHPDEIQRRRQRLAESSFDFRKMDSPPYHYQQLPLSGSGLDNARELMRCDVLNSLEKRSTLKHFSDQRPRSLGQRRVSFKLEDDDQAPAGTEPSGCAEGRSEKVLAPIVISRQDAENRAPAAKRPAKRPQSAKNRRRVGNSERTKEASASSAGSTDKCIPPKRPTSARPRLDEAAAQSLTRRPKSARRVASSHTMRSSATEQVASSGQMVKVTTDASPRPQAGSRVSASDTLATASTVATSSHFANQIATRAIHPQSSLIHNVTLATRSRQAETGVVNMSLADKMKTRKYLRISCHDWSCNCSHPECVTRYDFKEGQTHFDSFGPITVRKDFILPDGCRLAGTRGAPTQHPEPGSRDCQSVALREKALQREMEEFLAKKPISLQRAFRISGPHWVSRNHTQRWPWKGTTWVSVCGDEITNSRSRRSVK